MPTPCYLSITGKTQGNISAGAFTADSVGNVYVEGHEDEILIQAVNHSISVTTDSQGGQPTGQWVHSPLVLTCSLNRAIPLIMNSVVSGEVLPEVKLNWYRTSIDGKQEHFFTHLLEDAIVTDLSVGMPHAQNDDTSNHTQIVTITLSYRKVTMEHVVAGTSGSDDWRKPKTA